MENILADNQDEPDRPKPVFLLILDGWGIAGKSEVNAISLAKTPNLIRLVKEYPAVSLVAGNGSVNARYLSIGSGQEIKEENELVENDISALVAAAGLRQLKIFDSERMAALTYFFNGRREERLVGADWLTISSTDDQGSFRIDLLLERAMKESLKAVKGGQYDLIVAACPVLDIIASTGNFTETVALVEKIDKQVRRLTAEVMERGGVMVITSAHGNAERMKNLSSDLLDKEMTVNPVPLIIASQTFKGRTIGFNDAPDGDLSLLKPAGSLADITPTIAGLLGLDKTESMTGEDLILGD